MRDGLRENILSSLVVRNFVLRAAGAILLLRPDAILVKASPTPRGPCGMLLHDSKTNATASCSVVAYCSPE
jgi:hypothetical protein